jgi:hypothetical protein
VNRIDPFDIFGLLDWLDVEVDDHRFMTRTSSTGPLGGAPTSKKQIAD